MNRNLRIRTAVISLVLLTIGGLYLSLLKITDKTYLVEPEKFTLTKTTAGEIQSSKSQLINAPSGILNREYRIYSIKINDMIEEGKIVKKGDYIAMLDPSALQDNMRSNADKLQREEAELEKVIIDSTIKLGKIRQELKEIIYDIEYAKLDLDQSIYESPAYQRKMKMTYEITIRKYNTKMRDYQKQQIWQEVECNRRLDDVKRYRKQDEYYKNALSKVRITSPSNGMVMYAKDWDGSKIETGSSISLWNPQIAIIPDVSNLISEVFIDEVYVSQLSEGDAVTVSIDAFNNKTLTGYITSIANIGKIIQGSTTKAFKVEISVQQDNNEIKPYMTTSNEFVLFSEDSALTIPIEALFYENDNNFVYLKSTNNIVKQIVAPNVSNDKKVLIKSGLNPGDKILLSPPKNADEVAYK